MIQWKMNFGIMELMPRLSYKAKEISNYQHKIVQPFFSKPLPKEHKQILPVSVGH